MNSIPLGFVMGQCYHPTISSHHCSSLEVTFMLHLEYDPAACQSNGEQLVRYVDTGSERNGLSAVITALLAQQIALAK